MGKIRDNRMNPLEKVAMAGESEFAQQMYQKSPEELREIILKELGEARDHLH